jgi:hypothetical protein
MIDSDIARIALRCPECRSPITVSYLPGPQFPEWAWDCPWWPKGCRWRGAWPVNGEVISVDAGWPEPERK